MSKFLSNGSRFAFKRSASPVAYCAIHIKTGTRNEPKGCGGLAHFTEHLLFKGTHHRSASVINSRLERLGGELNAYTTKEETVIHATILKEDFNVAVSLLVELAYSSVFPLKELEKERGVVIEEIKSYKDSPAELIYDEFEDMIFAGTDLSNPVLGTASSVKKITREDVVGYYNSNFVSENMVFTVVADIPCERAVAVIEREISKFAPKSGELEFRSDDISIPEPLPMAPSFSKVLTKRSHQAHCIIGARGYSFYSPRRIPLILLVNYLGGPAANAKLNLLLREKYGLVYNVEVSYAQYRDAGAVTVYFGCDKSNVERCEELILKEIRTLRENLLSDRVLNQARKQLLGQLAISSDNAEAQLLSMGKSEMVFGEVIEMEQTRSMLESVTAEDVMMVANEIFAEDKLSKLYYL